MGLKEKIKTSPDSSGVYIFKNAGGQALYVGKANSLKKRLRNYLNPAGARLQKLMRDARKLELIRTANPEEALIVEASLIKDKKPRYNIAFRDDKTYPYIKITIQEDFPRVLVTRSFKSDGSLWFGPYVKAGDMKKTVRFIKRIFPYRSCRRLPKRACLAGRRACLEYSLSLCPGPCLGKVSQAEYRRNIKSIILFLEGRKEKLVKELNKRMKQYALRQNYEKAARVRDQLGLLSGVSRRSEQAALEELRRVLGLKNKPDRIEAFDVSNISGTDAVGSMVTFRGGRPEKSSYRRFKIKLDKGIDDYAMISEIVQRRYRRILKEGEALPDLIVIDGGKGQLKAALKVFKELKLDKLNVIAIAKRFEEIFLPGSKMPVQLDKKSTSLNLIRSIRDEAHRFAINYHRLRRRKSRLKR